VRTRPRAAFPAVILLRTLTHFIGYSFPTGSIFPPAFRPPRSCSGRATLPDRLPPQFGARPASRRTPMSGMCSQAVADVFAPAPDVPPVFMRQSTNPRTLLRARLVDARPLAIGLVNVEKLARRKTELACPYCSHAAGRQSRRAMPRHARRHRLRRLLLSRSMAAKSQPLTPRAIRRQPKSSRVHKMPTLALTSRSAANTPRASSRLSRSNVSNSDRPKAVAELLALCMLDPHDGQGLAGFTTGNEHPFIPAGESSSVPMPPRAAPESRRRARRC
jgi:hypothetical protein